MTPRYVIVLLFIWTLAGLKAGGEETGRQLTWSSSPSTAAILRSGEAGWHTVKDTELQIHLETESIVFITYAATVLASKSFLPGGDFAGEASDAFLGMRLCVDGIPYRQSGTHSNPISSFETVRTTLSGFLVASNLGIGTHVVQLQWRSWGSDITQWSIRPSVLGGTGGSRSLTAQARFRYIYNAQPLTSARLVSANTSAWQDVAGCFLEFALPRDWTLHIFYSLQLRPQLPPNVQGNSQ